MTSDESGPLKKVRKEAYRKVILEAAEKVFAQYGFEAAKMQAIANEAGIAVGTLYNVFGGKDELFSDVLTHRLPELLQTTSEAALKATSTFESLTKGLRCYIIFLLEHPDYLQIHLKEHAWGIGPTRATKEQLAAWREGLELEASVLKAAMAQGFVIPEDPYLLARCITAVHQVQLWNWIEQGREEPVTKVADRLDRLFLQMFCTAKAQEHA
jgi:AcrR family transcriptional regulator